jgi:hypothetical protein
MTERPFFLQDQMSNRVLSVIALIFMIIVMILTAGCTGEQKTEENKNFSDKQTGQFTKNIQTFSTTYASGTRLSRPGNQLYLDDIQKFLTDWNKLMDWGFSAEQIADFNRSLRNDYLKKYDKTGRSLSYNIPDMKTFCLELGDEIGLTKDQSEFFAASADDYYSRGKMTFHGAVPTRHFISFDHCNIRIERGKQAQINMTYKVAWDDPPATVRFNATQTPLTLVYSPSEISPVKPFHDYQAVTIITANSSLKPGRYQFRPSVEGKEWNELDCMDSDPYTGVHQNIVYVTVV